jgi:signal peptidase I
MVVAFLLWILIWLFIVLDAVHIVRRHSGPTERRRYNSWYVYVGAILVIGLVVQPALARVTRAMARTFTITSGSMEQTLLVGDYVIVNAMVAGRARHNDIITFSRPDGDLLFISRVVGLPGTTLAMQSGVLHINGVPQQEPHVRHIDPAGDTHHEWMQWQMPYVTTTVDLTAYRPTRDQWGPILVPADSYFVMGDNRDESLDSRYVGFVSADRIVGRVARVYFSWDADAGRIRWHRLGYKIR